MKHILEAGHIVFESAWRRILNGVFLQCETGKVTGLLGRNGGGKSCLMRIIFGDLKANEASVCIDGKFCPKQRDCREIRYLPQGHFMPDSFLIRHIFQDFKTDFDDFVQFFPEFRKYDGSRFGKLSGGERRLIEVYNVLASETEFCLLDEPFAQVTPLHIESLKKLIRRECGHKGILISDHFYRDVMEISDELYVLSGGRTLKVQNTEDLQRFGYLRDA